MAEETEPTEVETEETETPELEETETPEWTPPSREEWERLQNKAAKRDQLLRERQAELAKLKKPASTEPTEADRLRQGMVRTAGRAVLAALDVKDRDDQSAILDAIRLDGIEVDETGEVDTEELESRIEKLRKILGAPQVIKAPRPRVDTRDRGGRDVKPADPDTARYQRIINGGR